MKCVSVFVHACEFARMCIMIRVFSMSLIALRVGRASASNLHVSISETSRVQSSVCAAVGALMRKSLANCG